MRRFYIWLWLLMLVCGSCTKEKQELRVLHLNIWMEGTVVKNGFEAVADEVARIDPDIVMFSEASNKEGALFVPRMLDALRERGKIYYGQGSSLDVALLSKYPILEQTENIPHKDRVLRTRLDVNGKQVVAYTGHLDYTHYACYLPRGYSGVTWKKLEAPVTDKAEIEKANNESLRDESFTFPSDNPAMPVERLTWAPEADERDRIDFIYYIPATGWEVEDAVIVGPKSSIIRSQRVEEDSQDTFSTPADIWPTDHKGVLIKFKF